MTSVSLLNLIFGPCNVFLSLSSCLLVLSCSSWSEFLLNYLLDKLLFSMTLVQDWDVIMIVGDGRDCDSSCTLECCVPILYLMSQSPPATLTSCAQVRDAFCWSYVCSVVVGPCVDAQASCFWLPLVSGFSGCKSGPQVSVYLVSRR